MNQYDYFEKQIKKKLIPFIAEYYYDMKYLFRPDLAKSYYGNIP